MKRLLRLSVFICFAFIMQGCATYGFAPYTYTPGYSTYPTYSYGGYNNYGGGYGRGYGRGHHHHHHGW